MEKSFLPYFLIAAILFLLLKPAKVETITLQGSKDTIYVPKPVPYKVDSVIYKTKLVTKNKVVKEYVKDNKAWDSIKMLNDLVECKNKAIEDLKERYYRDTVKTKLYSVIVESKTRGYLDSTSIFVDIYPREVKLPKLEVFGGVSATTNGLMSIGVAVKKKDLYELDFNSDKSFRFSYRKKF